MEKNHKIVNFSSPIKFKILLQVQFDKETFNLLTIDNTYHTIKIKSLFGGIIPEDREYLMHELKDFLANELPDYPFIISCNEITVDSQLHMIMDFQANLYFCQVIHEEEGLNYYKNK